MPVWSPDGSRFAFTSDETLIVIGDPRGGRELVEVAEALSGEVTWSPDGQNAPPCAMGRGHGQYADRSLRARTVAVNRPIRI